MFSTGLFASIMSRSSSLPENVEKEIGDENNDCKEIVVKNYESDKDIKLNISMSSYFDDKFDTDWGQLEIEINNNAIKDNEIKEVVINSIDEIKVDNEIKEEINEVVSSIVNIEEPIQIVLHNEYESDFENEEDEEDDEDEEDEDDD